MFMTKKQAQLLLLAAGVLMLLFGLGGTTYGMWEETMAFYPLLIPVFLAAGYDAVVGISVILLGAGAGVICSTVNPFATGIAAGFAWSLLGLPMPTMAGKTLSSIASLTSPLALLAIGAGFKGRKALGYLRPTAVATAVKLMALPALFLPVAVHLGFTDEKLVALLVMLGSIATPSCYVMAKQMGHEGVLTGSVCVTTTLFSAFSLTFWLFLLRSMGCIA